METLVKMTTGGEGGDSCLKMSLVASSFVLS